MGWIVRQKPEAGSQMSEGKGPEALLLAEPTRVRESDLRFSLCRTEAADGTCSTILNKPGKILRMSFCKNKATKLLKTQGRLRKTNSKRTLDESVS